MPKETTRSPSTSTSAADGFDWALVRSFLAVIDAGSLTQAARRTGAHQPTLSRHIAELEAQLGAPLFERTGRGVTPTAAGQAIVEGARAMRAGAQALSLRLAGERDRPAGTVRLTTSQVAAHHLLPALLARLADEEPGIQIELVAANTLSNLLRREADIAIRMVRPAQTSLVARRLGTVTVGAFAHRDYLARHGTPRGPNDLDGHRLVGMDTDDTLRRGFARFGMPMTRERFQLRTDDHVAIGRLVACGAGIGFLAHYHAAALPGAVPVLPGLRIPSLPCWLAVHREIRASRPVRRVFDFLAATIPPTLAAHAG